MNSIFYVGVDAIKDVSLSKVAVIIVIDPKYLHVALADLLESRLKGLRMKKVQNLRTWGRINILRSTEQLRRGVKGS